LRRRPSSSLFPYTTLFRSCFILIVLTAICGLSGQLHAKVVAGVSGIITDASGAVVADAAIQMKAIDTGLVETRQTNTDGFYAFVDRKSTRLNSSHLGISYA